MTLLLKIVPDILLEPLLRLPLALGLHYLLNTCYSDSAAITTEEQSQHQETGFTFAVLLGNALFAVPKTRVAVGFG